MKVPSFLSHWLIDYLRWLSLGVGAVILGLGYTFLLAGKIETVRTDGLIRRSETEAQLKSDTDYRDALKTSADSFQQKISTADKETIEAFIPTGSDFPTLLLTIQDMANRAGLELKDVNVNEIGQIAATSDTAPVAASDGTTTAIAQAATAQGVNLRTQDIAVTVSGIQSYDDVKRFATIIESSRRLFDIISINFALSVNEGATEGTATAGSPVTLTLRTYYLPTTN